MRFYLGTDRTRWLWTLTDVPLFVSHRTLRSRKSRFPRATTPWALDSGGFTELSLQGKWETTPQQYAEALSRYDSELGHMEWASPQDWMCEPWIVEKTGLSVREHQARTIESVLTLRDIAPGLDVIPVLQGWEIDDYHRHVDDYAAAGIDLASEPLVGVGSVCRRQATSEIDRLMDTLRSHGLRLHGFGVKVDGLVSYSDALRSADSFAWSYAGRRRPDPTHTHKARSCAHCLDFALAWRRRVLRACATPQLRFDLGGVR